MKTRIAVVADLHYSSEANLMIPKRKGQFADIMLLRTVHRLNRWIKPDVTLIPGDLINDPNASEAPELLGELKRIIDLLESPVLVLPGNHDPAPENFYKIFERPKSVTEFGDIRIVSFPDDREEPGYNASRTAEDIALLRQARENFAGPVVSLQHVPLFSPGLTSCPYNYTNAETIIQAMRDAGTNLAISGHFHEGFDLVRQDDTAFLAAPALCESPFGFLLVEIDTVSGEIEVFKHFLSMPEKLELMDFHVHTKLAYCNENMDVRTALELGTMFGLADIAFAEHSAHLYFNREDYGKRLFFHEGVTSATVVDRTADYFKLIEAEADGRGCLGMEVDFDKTGCPVIKQEAWNKLKFRSGAVHCLSDYADKNKSNDEFLKLTHEIVTSGVDVLAHPFRIFRRRGLGDPSKELFGPVVKMLKEHNVAAEINFHTNEPPLEFVKLCLEAGVRLSLGSDSHNLYEVGEFFPHLELLKAAGCDSPDDTILLNMKNLRRKDV